MNSNHVICLFRHGETERNVEGKRQEHLDPPLTQKGELQAGENAKRLRQRISSNEGFSFFASPLGRARRTASIMAAELEICEQAIIYEPRLMECSFGAWEGLTTSEIRAGFPNEWQARSLDK